MDGFVSCPSPFSYFSHLTVPVLVGGDKRPGPVLVAPVEPVRLSSLTSWVQSDQSQRASTRRCCGSTLVHIISEQVQCTKDSFTHTHSSLSLAVSALMTAATPVSAGVGVEPCCGGPQGSATTSTHVTSEIHPDTPSIPRWARDNR